MFERFNERARHVVVLAQEESRALKHNYIGTEHILLGLLREEEGVAARVLESLHITVERVRVQVVRIVGAGEEVTSGQIPFTPRAKKILELALREALSLGHNYIGTEHILLGLVRENEGVAARVLLDFDADAEKVRREVIRTLSGPEVRQSVEAVMGGARITRGGFDVAWVDGLGAVFDRLGVEIRGQLGRDPDAGDLLLVLACALDMVPGRALSELGIDLDALWGAIEHAREQPSRAREQAVVARRQLTDQILELRVAKDQAIEADEFERAANLRDQERQLTEEQTRRDAISMPDEEMLRQVRRRLGIPEADDPPQPS
jgi:ATP-dependent Clp protease ATP-binding subunit ClpA